MLQDRVLITHAQFEVDRFSETVGEIEPIRVAYWQADVGAAYFPSNGGVNKCVAYPLGADKPMDGEDLEG